MSNWKEESLISLETIRDNISLHRKNGTTFTYEGLLALEMLLNMNIKIVRSLKNGDEK